MSRIVSIPPRTGVLPDDSQLTIVDRSGGDVRRRRALAAQQRPTLSPAVRAYVSVDAPLIALTHARVIDGTGAAPREDQTLILNNGVITTMGSSASTDVPAGAQTIDLTGKSVIPGLVMVHEHLYYPNGPGVYGQLGE